MMDAMKYVASNPVEVLTALGSALYALTWLAALTPNKKDDSAVAKARTVLDFFAGNVLNAKNK